MVGGDLDGLERSIFEKRIGLLTSPGEIVREKKNRKRKGTLMDQKSVRRERTLRADRQTKNRRQKQKETWPWSRVSPKENRSDGRTHALSLLSALLSNGPGWHGSSIP
jgi:hypothetical protein